MGTIIQFFNFIVLMSVFYLEGWFDGIDPTSNIEFSIEAIMLSVGVTMSVVFIGIAISKIFAKFIHIGPMVLGAILSYFITIYLLLIAQGTTDFFSDSDQPDSLSAQASLIISAFGILIGLWAGIKCSFMIIYFTSAFTASYLIVRGVSIWLGNFMSEADMVRGIFTEEDIPPMNSGMMTYSLAIFVLWFFIVTATFRKQSAAK
jgi:hypothetical protein